MTELDRASTAVEREWSRFLARLRACPEARWATPTRCAGWTVADLAAHTVWGVSLEVDGLRRARAGDPGPAVGQVVEAGADPVKVTRALDDAVGALLRELHRLGAVSSSSVPGDRTLPMPYGDVPLALMLPIFVMEAGVHGDDLAEALGEQQGLAPDVVVATTMFLRSFLPALAAGSGDRPPRPADWLLTGSSVMLRVAWNGADWTVEDAPGSREADAMVSGDDSAVVLYALGRLPVDSTRLAVQGDTALARRFKSFIPGP